MKQPSLKVRIPALGEERYPRANRIGGASPDPPCREATERDLRLPHSRGQKRLACSVHSCYTSFWVLVMTQ